MDRGKFFGVADTLAAHTPARYNNPNSIAKLFLRAGVPP